MARLVMKFGGTSVADLDRIRNVARHVKREVDAGYDVAVVVSAMSGVTNQLVAWCKDAAPLHDTREYDAVVATGEQVTAGLLAITLEGMGVNARSWQGWQLPILTNNVHGSARIADVNGAELIKRFEEHKQVAVIAGFQGMHKDTGRITTLGRGGSDTSAVAIAAAIGAERCDIYTDVDGVYTTDPRVAPKARRLEKVAFEEMLEMASLGAKVMQVRSIELGMNRNVRIFVRSSFVKPEDIDPHKTPPGTLICDESEIMEQQTVTGIAVHAKLDPPRTGQAGRRCRDLRTAGRRQHQRRHDRAERLGRRRDHRPHLHGALGGLRARPHDHREGQGQYRLRPHRRLDRRRQGLGHRYRHAQPCRRRGAGLQGAVGREDQHPRDHDLINASQTDQAVRTLHTLYGLDKA
jgi:uridylate kinase